MSGFPWASSFLSGQDFFHLNNVEGNRQGLARNRRRLADNRRRLEGNRRWLEGNHLDIWVASEKKIAGETAVVKKSKTGDIRAYGLHQNKDKNSRWKRNGHNVQIWLTTEHSSFFFPITKRPAWARSAMPLHCAGALDEHVDPPAPHEHPTEYFKGGGTGDLPQPYSGPLQGHATRGVWPLQWGICSNLCGGERYAWSPRRCLKIGRGTVPTRSELQGDRGTPSPCCTGTRLRPKLLNSQFSAVSVKCHASQNAYMGSEKTCSASGLSLVNEFFFLRTAGGHRLAAGGYRQ